MKRFYALFFLFLLPEAAFAGVKETYTLADAIRYALEHNPGINASVTDIEIERQGVALAAAEKMPRLDLVGHAARYRYDTPVTPISGSPLSGAGFPEFDNTIYDGGISFSMPLYRGGRLDRAVSIARITQSVAEDKLRMTRQELIYNITSVYCKISQLVKLLESNDASVRQLEEHKKNVEAFLEAGTVPLVELLKTHTELANARNSALVTENNLKSAQELLKTLMGIEDAGREVSVVPEMPPQDDNPPYEKSVEKALSQRPDFHALLKKKMIAEKRIEFAGGKRLPSLLLSGEYLGRSGSDFDARENWNIVLSLSVPLFDGGAVKASVKRETWELEKLRQEERALRLEIVREIRDAYLRIDNARERQNVVREAVATAAENMRIERLKYETGAGTSTDVIDAQTALLRAEADLFQAAFDQQIAEASLRKAVGEDIYEEVLQ